MIDAGALAGVFRPSYLHGMRRILTMCLAAAIAAPLAMSSVDAQGARRGDQSRLTRADLDEAGTAIVTAFDAVRVLRPRWLAPPLGKSASATMLGGGGGASAVIVYVDGTRQPDLEPALTRVKAADVTDLRYLDQNRAVQEHGPGHEAGVIEVTTIRKRK